MNSASGSPIPERPPREFGVLEMTMRDELEALLYLLFVAGLGLLLLCASVVHWPFSRDRLAARKD
jgi:hypothetical protein